jgi:hypothetical protein
VHVVPAALSDATGLGVLYVIGPGEGRNSLYPNDGQQKEAVSTTTADKYCEDNNIPAVALMKVDAEGHDMRVIEGSARLLSERRVSVIQFEYSYRWIAARRYLKDAFDLAMNLDYRVAKVTPLGIEPYSRWDPELETFREANFIIARPEALTWFPRTEWWNAQV